MFLAILFAAKIGSLVYPPLPGSILTISTIPVLGWQTAYLVDFAGSFVGSSLTYWLGKKYGYPFLHKVLDEGIVERIKKIKIRKDREIEGVVVVRVLTGAVAIEAVNYAAGLFGVRDRNFLVGFLISHPLISVPMFYVTNEIFAGKNIWLSAGLLVVAVLLMIKLKGRYLE